MRVTRLTIFSHLWAIAGLCEWIRWTWTETGWSWGLFVSSTALFLLPNSVACLALFAGTQVVFTALAANRPWNHGLWMALMNVGILVSIARVAVERGRAPGGREVAWDAERLVETFAPPLRASLVALYLFTFLHKLNSDFLEPDVSCAGVLLGWINRSYRVLPQDEWAVVLGIWGTLFVELAVPLMLCWRRTVYVGLLLGAGFHLFLSQYGGLHGFAAMLFAVYFLFLPRTFTADVAERFRELLQRYGIRRLRHVLLPALVALLLVLGKLLGHLFGISYTYRGLLFWDVWLLAVLACFARAFLRVRRSPPEAGLRPHWAPLWAVPLAVVLNGLSPYLGLKTETSWSMYSNLRTEVRPNHFLAPAWARVFAFQDELVEILDTSLPAFETYVGSEVRMTLFEFRRACSAAEGDFFARYRWGGREGRLEVAGGVPSDPLLCRPHSWLSDKLLRFRPVDVGAHATCRH